MKYSPLFILILSFLAAGKPIPESGRTDSNSNREHAAWDGNQVFTIHGNHGNMVDYDLTGNSALVWPEGSDNGIIFQSGFWLVAGKVNGINELRSAASEYVSEFSPGKVGGSAESGHLYQIQKAEIEAFLNHSWTEFSTMTLMLPHTAKEGSLVYTELVETPLPTDDFLNWPVEDGAPWVDGNGDGFYNPQDGDYPDIKGDMFHWYVMNDFDGEAHSHLWDTPSLGLNVRVSLYGFDIPGPAQNTVFVEWEIENAGPDTLDSLFIGWWADMDVQSANNDLVGCDTLLNLAYTYNGYSFSLEIPPSAGGLVFLQTPIVPSPGDTAQVDHLPVLDYRNLPLYAHAGYRGGDPVYKDPNNAEGAYRLLNGLISGNGLPYLNPITGAADRFFASGNPITGEGWLDGWSPDDRRQILSAGPLQMIPGDVQQIAGAIVLADGINPIASIANLKVSASYVRDIWASNFNVLSPMTLVEELTDFNNTESLGTFSFQFHIQPGFGEDFSSQSYWLHYGLDSPVDSVPITMHTEAGETTFVALIPAYGNLTGTDTLRYFVSINDDDGSSSTYPIGAPVNYKEFVFGPDRTPPRITVPTPVDTVQFLLPFKRFVFLDEFYDDRFEHTQPVLHWVINGRRQHAVAMDLVPVYSPYWVGLIDAPPMGSTGDSLRYWVTSFDLSSNRNRISTDTLTVYSGESQKIGNWEYYNSLRQYNLRNYYWDYFNNYHFYATAVAGITGGLRTALSSADSDTLTFINEINLSCVENATLSIRYVRAGGSAFSAQEWVQGSNNGIDWFDLESLSSNAYPEINDVVINLNPGPESEHFTFRIIVKRTVSNLITYVFDDIILNADSAVPCLEPPVPQTFLLRQNYPNPFNPVTTIKYDLPEATHVKLVIIDLLGREAAVLVDSYQPPGAREIRFDAGSLASGMYFYRLTADNKQFTRKMVVLK